MGYFEGPDEEFSFCDAYAPADFATVRGCDARVWDFFPHRGDGMEQYTDYAMGYDLDNRLPLWVKPRTKVDPKTLFDAMRSHYEGTPMDMTTDPRRRRSRTAVSLASDGLRGGRRDLSERAGNGHAADRFLVHGTGPSLAADDMGILWFGVDDTATSCLTPIYCSTTEVPVCFSEETASMLRYSPVSAFWLFNRVTNFAYLRYDMISADIRKVTDQWENARLEEVKQIDEKDALSQSRPRNAGRS